MEPAILIVWPKVVVTNSLKVTATEVAVAHEEVVVEVEVVLVADVLVVGELPPPPLGVCDEGQEVALAVE